MDVPNANSPALVEPTDPAADGVGERPGGRGDLSGPTGDPGVAQRPIAARDLDSIEAVLVAVERALSRIDTAVYGRCESCGDPLDDSLLVGDPTASACAGCTPASAG